MAGAIVWEDSSTRSNSWFPSWWIGPGRSGPEWPGLWPLACTLFTFRLLRGFLPLPNAQDKRMERSHLSLCARRWKKESHSPFFRENNWDGGSSHYWIVPIIGDIPLLGRSHYWGLPFRGEFIFSISWRSVGLPLSQGLGSHQTVEFLVNIDPSLKIIFW